MASPPHKPERRKHQKDSHVRIIYKPTGEAVECTLPRTKMVLSQTFRTINMAKLRPRDPCGDFLNALTNVVLEHPAYLSMEDCPRYASLIQAFSAFNTTLASAAAVVANVPLADLHIALAQWVEHSIGSSDAHPLMSSYVLDAAELIEAHAYGKHMDSANLEAMVDFGRQRAQPPIDWRIKRNLTQSIQGLLVRAQVPPGSSFIPISPRFGAALAGPCEVYAMLKRCHLSDPVHDLRHFELADVLRPTFDLMDNFRFPAVFVPAEQVEALLGGTPPPGDLQLGLDLPGSWITACLDPESMQWRPVPAWVGPAAPSNT